MLTNCWKAPINKGIPIFAFDSLQLHTRNKWKPP